MRAPRFLNVRRPAAQVIRRDSAGSGTPDAEPVIPTAASAAGGRHRARPGDTGRDARAEGPPRGASPDPADGRHRTPPGDRLERAKRRLGELGQGLREATSRENLGQKLTAGTLAATSILPVAGPAATVLAVGTAAAITAAQDDGAGAARSNGSSAPPERTEPERYRFGGQTVHDVVSEREVPLTEPQEVAHRVLTGLLERHEALRSHADGEPAPLSPEAREAANELEAIIDIALPPEPPPAPQVANPRQADAAELGQLSGVGTEERPLDVAALDRLTAHFEARGLALEEVEEHLADRDQTMPESEGTLVTYVVQMLEGGQYVVDVPRDEHRVPTLTPEQQHALNLYDHLDPAGRDTLAKLTGYQGPADEAARLQAETLHNWVVTPQLLDATVALFTKHEVPLATLATPESAQATLTALQEDLAAEAAAAEAERKAREEAERLAAEAAAAAAAEAADRELRSRVMDLAASLQGTPYVYGGTTPRGFDCSGYVQYVFAQLGVSLPRVSGDQAAAGPRVSQAEARPGDLVSIPGHIGIYAGDGMMWHSPHPGAVVSKVPLWGSGWTFTRVL